MCYLKGLLVFTTLGLNVLINRVVVSPLRIPMLGHPGLIHLLNVGFAENFMMTLTAQL